MSEPLFLTLPKFSEHRYENRWFKDVNRYSTPRTYRWVRIPDDIFSEYTIEFDDIMFWNPFPEPPRWWGHYTIKNALEGRPTGYAPLGITFAEAMLDRRWPASWDARFVACLGTIMTISRASPMYPRLECGRAGTVQLTWRPTSRLQRSERVALYPAIT